MHLSAGRQSGQYEITAKWRPNVPGPFNVPESVSHTQALLEPSVHIGEMRSGSGDRRIRCSSDSNDVRCVVVGDAVAAVWTLSRNACPAAVPMVGLRAGAPRTVGSTQWTRLEPYCRQSGEHPTPRDKRQPPYRVFWFGPPLRPPCRDSR